MSFWAENLGAIAAVMPRLLRGAVYTLGTALVAQAIGTVLGLSLALVRLYAKPVWRTLVAGYVDLLRGTPLLVQLLFVYFGIPGLVNAITGEPFSIPPLVAAIIAFGLNSGAYLCEIYRAGIQSIDRGQWEAARSLGMTGRQTFLAVILPQAFRRSLPAAGNDFIILIKDTSLLSVIAVTEITKEGQLFIARTYAAFPAYIAIALTYLAITFTVSRLINRLEKKMETP